MGERSGIENNDIKRDKLWERERDRSFYLSFSLFSPPFPLSPRLPPSHLLYFIFPVS